MKFLERAQLDQATLDRQTEVIVQKITADVAPLIAEMKTHKIRAHQIAKWQGGLSLLTRLIENGEPLDLQAVKAEIARIPAKSFNRDEDFGLLHVPLENAMLSKPRASLTGWLTARTKEATQTFNAGLRTAAGTIKTQAETSVANLKLKTDQEEGRLLTELTASLEFLRPLVWAVKAQDRAHLLSVLQSPAAQAVSPDVKAVLLAAPLASGKSVLASLPDLPFATIRDEAEFLQDFTRTLGNEALSLQFLHASMNGIQDETKKDRYRAYLSAFAGTYIPLSDNVLVNPNSFTSIDLENSELRVYNSRGTIPVKWHMPAEQARAFLGTVALRPHMIQVDRNTLLNANAASVVWHNDDRIKFYNTQGKYISYWDVKPAQGAAIIAAVAARPNYTRITDVEYAQVNAATAIWSTKGEFRLYNGQGKVMHTWTNVSETESAKILAGFAGRPHFTGVDKDEFINTNSWAIVTHADNELKLYNGAGKRALLWDNVSRHAVQPVLDAYAKKPGVIEAFDGVLFNPNSWAAISYEKEELGLFDAAGKKAHGWPMTSEQAQRILDAVATRPNMVAVASNIFVNANSWGAAINDEGEFKVYGTQETRSLKWASLKWQVGDESARDTLERFIARPNYLKLKDGVAVNANSWAMVEHEKGEIKFRAPNNQYALGWKVEPNDAQAFLKAIRTLGQTATLKTDFAGHASVLKQALGSSSGSSTSLTHDNDGILLPFLAAAFMWASVDNAFANEDERHHSGFESGGGGDFNGGGASGNFPEGGASDGETQEITASDSEPDAGVEAEVEADGGADMDAGVDVDMADTTPDTGYDTGGGDMGGGGGGGGGVSECTSDPMADPLFASVMDGTFGKGRFKSADFEMR